MDEKRDQNSKWIGINSGEVPSSDILLSFDAKWLQAFREEAPQIIIRKRIPRKISPAKVFMYFGAPESKVLGYFVPEQISDLAVEQVMMKESAAKLSRREIASYCGDRTEIGCYFLRNTVIFKREIHLSEIRTFARFYPPQSFSQLSIIGRNWILKMAEEHAT